MAGKPVLCSSDMRLRLRQLTSYVFECSTRVQAPKKLFRSRLIGDALGSVMKRIEVDRANSLMWVFVFPVAFLRQIFSRILHDVDIPGIQIYAAFSLYDRFAINIYHAACVPYTRSTRRLHTRVSEACLPLSGWLYCPHVVDDPTCAFSFTLFGSSVCPARRSKKGRQGLTRPVRTAQDHEPSCPSLSSIATSGSKEVGSRRQVGDPHRLPGRYLEAS